MVRILNRINPERKTVMIVRAAYRSRRLAASSPSFDQKVTLNAG
jgi:hypothetical protein